MDIIERAARALCEQHIRNVRRHDTELPKLEKMLPGSVDYAWRDFIPQARAVLAAIREPDEGMIEAGYNARDKERRVSAIWQAMIDEALREN